MKIILSKTVQYDLSEPDDVFCNDCSFVSPKRCILFFKGLHKQKGDKSFRRCSNCLFAEVKPMLDFDVGPANKNAMFKQIKEA